MNKKDFASKLAYQAAISKPKAMEITNAMVSIIKESLNQRENIQFKGFGSFEIKLTHERMARNPRTMEDVLIPERYKAVFRPSSCLLEVLNRGIDK